MPLAIFEGPLVTLLGGFLSTIHVMNPLYVYIIGVCGDIVGDSIFYGVGRLSSKQVYKRGHYVGISDEKIKYVKDIFSRNERKALVLSKVVHGIGSGGLIVAGILKISFKQYLKTVSVVAIFQSAILLSIGILCGSAYEMLGRYLNIYATYASVVAILIICIVCVFKFKNGIKNKYER